MVAEKLTCPDDFDPEDIEFVRHLVPDGSIVTDLIAVVGWMDPDTGSRRWRAYLGTVGTPATGVIGLLEFAKLDIIGRSETGLPVRYDDNDE